MERPHVGILTTEIDELPTNSQLTFILWVDCELSQPIQL